MRKMKGTITFEKSAKRQILGLFGLIVDAQGFIIEKGSCKKICSPEGDHLQLRDFAGFKNGSMVFIKSDITSLINLSDTLN